MPFEKGKEKTGGRKPGVKNKTTDQIREAIGQVLSNKIDELADDLLTMSPFQQWMILDKVAKYRIPALNKNEDTVAHSGEVKVIVTYEDTPTGDNSTEYGED